MFGGVMKNVINPTNLAMLAMGPGGWAALAARTLMTAVGQQVIQQLGDKLGLPQGAIDLAQGAFCASMGDTQGVTQNLSEAVSQIGGQYGASPAEQGEAERNIQDTIRDIVNQQSESEDLKAARGGQKGGSGGSWLMAIASILGEKLNSMAHELTGLAQQAADDPSKGTIFGAKSQEFGILMNSANNGLKSIGEGLQTMARKN